MPGRYRVTAQKLEPMVILPTTTTLADAYLKTSAPADAYTLRETPLKPVPPCHRDGIADVFQEDNGGKDGGKPVATAEPVVPPVANGGSGGKPVANPFGTVKSLDADGESPPVARWQANSGGREEGVCGPSETPSEPYDNRIDGDPGEDRTCQQCGSRDGTERLYTIGGEQVWLHVECHGYRLRAAKEEDLPW
jgi:hypothetical protein